MSEKNTSSSSSSSSSSSIRLPPFDHSLSEDEKVVHSFLEIIQNKVEQGILTSLEPLEKKMLLDSILHPGVYMASLTTLTSFLVLRKAPKYIMNRFIIPYYYHPTSILAPLIQKTPLPLPPFTEPTYFKPISIFLDLCMSTLVGVTTWIACLNKAQIYQTIEDIPLIAGYSQLSTSLCTDFIHHYKQNIPSTFWIQNEDDILKTITHVIENCMKRQAYEKYVLQSERIEEREGEEEVQFTTSSIALPTPVPKDILQQILKQPQDYEEDDFFSLQELLEEEEEISNWAEVDD